MPRDTARMEGPLERTLMFALAGLAGGILIGAGFAAPIWLSGGAERGGAGAIAGLLIGFPVGGFVAGILVGAVREGLGAMVQRGGHGRSPSEYSRAQSLVMRGAYREAVDAYSKRAAENRADPEPLIRGARVLRDHMRQHDAAAEWLHRAGRTPGLTPQQDITIARELVGLYEGPLASPERAMPVLARIAETYPGTTAAEWARNTLGGLRAAAWSDLELEAED